jgi:hypothetical protein
VAAFQDTADARKFIAPLRSPSFGAIQARVQQLRQSGGLLAYPQK